MSKFKSDKVMPHYFAIAVVLTLIGFAVVGKATMCAVMRVSPGLVVAIDGIGICLQILRVLYQIGQIRLEGRGETRLLTHLLEGNVVPRLVCNDVGKRRARRIGAFAVLHLAVFEGIVGLRDVNPVRLESLTTTIGIADNHLHTSLLCQFP